MVVFFISSFLENVKRIAVSIYFFTKIKARWHGYDKGFS